MEKNRILIIDDEQALLDVFTEMLHINGFNVDTAETGTQAIKKIDAYAYTLIIVDIKLTDMSGYKICQYIKEEKCNTIPVVGMTGAYWLDGNDQFDTVLLKPFSQEDLNTIITKLIN